MLRFRLVLIAAWMCTVVSGRSLAVELPPRTAITHLVSLSGDSQTSPMIGYPDTKSGMRLGGDIAQALQQRFGVEADVVPSRQIPTQAYRDRTVILLGNVANNPEIRWLYSFNYAFADGVYPGHEGYVIRQIFDPVGAGKNALLIGASSDVGLSQGVARFVTEVNRLRQPLWNRNLIVKSTLSIVQTPPPRLTDASIHTLEANSLKRMQNGRLWHEAHAIIHMAHCWYLTGNQAYLQRYHAMVGAHQKFTKRQPNQFYDGLEFWLPSYIQAWDVVEESKFWTQEQRNQYTQFLITLGQLLAERYHNFVDDPGPRPRWNHETQPALAYYFLSAYLEKYRNNIEPARRLSQYAQLVLGDQTHFVRGTDESGLYLPYAPSSALRYAIASRQHDMITSGRAAEFGKLLRMLTDNTGRFVGAANRESENIAYYYQLPLMTIIGNDALHGLDRKTRRAIEQPREPRDDWGVKKRFGEYRPPWRHVPKTSDDAPQSQTSAGVGPQIDVFPMDKGLFARTNTDPFYARVPLVKSTVPIQKAFDKLVFREGPQESNQYLLLDGYGRGQHYRYDTNAILRFTADDRVFLVGTDDDQRVAETFHNTLTFIRNGRGHEHVPPFAQLDAVADLPHTGVAISTVDDYAGLTWSRNIVWLKGALFAIVDQVEAAAGGEYNLRCHWNGLGQATIEPDQFHLEQNGRTCTVNGDARAQTSLTQDRSDAAERWSDYPYAAPVIQRIKQTRTLQLKRGERSALCHLICTHDSAEPSPARVHDATPNRVVFSEGDHLNVLYLANSAIPAPFVTDAKLALFDQRRITLVQATSLRIDDTEVLQAQEPVDCEWDVVAQTIVFSRQSRAKKSRYQPPRNVQATLLTLLKNVRREISQHQPEPKPIGRVLAVSETELTARIHTALVPAAGSDADHPVIVATSGECQALHVDQRAQVRPLWRVDAADPITVLAHSNSHIADADVIYGTQDGVVARISAAGQPRWQRRLDAPQGLAREITCLLADDIDSDGHQDLIVGTGLWNVYAFDDKGGALWKTPAYARRILSLAAGDLNGKGSKDLLIGSSYYTLSGYNARGKALFSYTGEPRFQHVLAADLDGDHRSEAIAANGTQIVVLDVQSDRLKPQTYVKGMNLPRGSKVRFQFDAGDEINSLICVDLNSNSNPEIIAGAESGYVYRFDARGELQLRNAGGAIHALAAGRTGAGRFIIAAALADQPHVVLMDSNLKPLGRAKFKHPVRWLSVRTDGVLCVTPQSMGMIRDTNP